MVEKEVRFLIDAEKKEEILKQCIEVGEEKRVVDITIGKDGFNSLSNYGYIIRIRNKNGKTTLEVKKRTDTNEWEEYGTEINDVPNTLKMFELMGYVPYLLIDRKRISAKYGDLILEFDDVDLLGEYLEIEYQESDYNKVVELITKFNIENNPEKLYGDIFKEKVETDEVFNNNFVKKLAKYMEA